MAQPTIILVPGAWHLPPAYKPLADILAAAPFSFPVKTVRTPSVDSHPPLKSFDDDVAAVRGAIVEAIDRTGEGEVWVLMHSYGGIPGSEAVQGLTTEERKKSGLAGGVSRLVYMTAFVALKGESLSDTKARDTATPVASEPTTNEPGNIIVPADRAVDFFYNDVDEAQVKSTQEHVKPHSAATFGSPVSHEPWRTIPSLYIICEDDKAISLAGQEGMVKQKGGWITNENGWKVVRLPTGHSPFLTMPHKVAEAVDDFYKASKA